MPKMRVIALEPTQAQLLSPNRSVRPPPAVAAAVAAAAGGVDDADAEDPAEGESDTGQVQE